MIGRWVSLIAIVVGLGSRVPRVAAQDTTVATAAVAPGKRLQAKVWVNKTSRVYHCPGTRYYGKTKDGTYMSEAAARGDGNRAASRDGCDPGLTATTPPGAGPDRVWVNTDSGIYTCPGARYYGKTKQGKFMTEPAAAEAGYRPSSGKKCF